MEDSLNSSRRAYLYPEDDEMILAALEDYYKRLKDSYEIARCERLISQWRRVLARRQ